LQAKAFVFIALSFMGIYIVAVYVLGQGNILNPYSFWGQPFKMTAAILYVLLIPVYLSFYVLTQLMSPSKKILKCITDHGSLNYSGILEGVKQESFIDTRLNDLVLSGCVKKAGNRYWVSPSGKTIAAVLNVMQHILGRGIGG